MASLDSSRMNGLIDLLEHAHRRYVLYYLTNESEAVDITTLAAVISTWAGGHKRTDRTDDRSNIEIALHHTHLPKLADAGIIRYDTTSRRVEFNGTAWLGRILVETAPLGSYTPVAPGN